MYTFRKFIDITPFDKMEWLDEIEFNKSEDARAYAIKLSSENNGWPVAFMKDTSVNFKIVVGQKTDNG